MEKYAILHVLHRCVCTNCMAFMFNQPLDEGIYWSVNFNRFHQHFHDQVPSSVSCILDGYHLSDSHSLMHAMQAIVSAVAEKIDEVCSCVQSPSIMQKHSICILLCTCINIMICIQARIVSRDNLHDACIAMLSVIDTRYTARALHSSHNVSHRLQPL